MHVCVGLCLCLRQRDRETERQRDYPADSFCHPCRQRGWSPEHFKYDVHGCVRVCERDRETEKEREILCLYIYVCIYI